MSSMAMAKSLSSNPGEPIKVTQRKRSQIKKTCFDLSVDINDDDDDLGLHRQMSEPVKVYMSCGVGSKGSKDAKKKNEDCSSGSDGEASQATTSPSTVSGCSTPGVTFSACTSMKSSNVEDVPPGSPNTSPVAALGLLDLPPGLEAPPGLHPEGTSKKDDSEEPAKVPTPFCTTSLSASAPEFTPGNEEASAENMRATNTVTVTELPEQYTRESLVMELQDSGFAEGRDYDYLTVPMLNAHMNKGVCFINFVNAGLRHAFMAAFQGREMRMYGLGRPVSVKPCTLSDLQKGAIASSPESRRAKFCPQCGGSIQGSFNFCTQCGNPLKNLP